MAERGPSYTEQAARAAVAASLSYAETLRRLQMCPSGGAHLVLKKYLEIWAIPTDHFDPYATHRRRNGRIERRPLEEILVQGSEYHRGHLKRRLFEAGLKQRVCELCGQGELWRGRRMSLILDHVNGIRDDNRLENLRIMGPNCAATLVTHCGRKNKLEPRQSSLRCGLSAEVLAPALLLPGLRLSTRQKSPARPAPRRVEGRTTDSPAADG